MNAWRGGRTEHNQQRHRLLVLPRERRPHFRIAAHRRLRLRLVAILVLVLTLVLEALVEPRRVVPVTKLVAREEAHLHFLYRARRMSVYIAAPARDLSKMLVLQWGLGEVMGS